MNPISPIPQEALARRRARFQAQLGDGVALVPGAKRVRRSNDVDYAFRQRSDLLYLTGFDQPDAVALLSRDRFVLFVQPRDPAAETWTGRRPGMEGALRDYGADEAYAIGELPEQLPLYLENVPRLYHRFGDDPDLDEIVHLALNRVRGRVRAGITAPEETVSPQSLLHEMRLIKEDCELEILRAAAEISREAHQAAALACREGAWEYEIEAALLHVFRARGGSGPAYPPIVGAGENATILHYIENCSRLAAGQLVLIDAGVELHGYASDVTRTYPVGGRFEGRAREVYAAVLRAQQDALAAIDVGTSLWAIHEVAARSLVKGLLELGVLGGAPDELFEEQAYQPFYMHTTGHFLGLDVHDMGNYNVGGKPRPLEPGMVFTVEPGLYFSVDNERIPEELRGIGVRIEDDVALTSEGTVEILTEAIPKEIDDVEAWMRA